MTHGVERRQFGRINSRLAAWLEIPGRSPMPCWVENISIAGAAIVVRDISWLPFRVGLYIEASKFRTECEVMRMSGDRVGVRFVSDEARPGVSRAQPPTALEATSWTGRQGDASGSANPTPRFKR